jgi:hypothetical protein
VRIRWSRWPSSAMSRGLRSSVQKARNGAVRSVRSLRGRRHPHRPRGDERRGGAGEDPQGHDGADPRGLGLEAWPSTWRPAKAASLDRQAGSAATTPGKFMNSASVLGTAAFDYALAAASETVMDIRVQLSSCVPATDPQRSNSCGVMREDSMCRWVSMKPGTAIRPRASITLGTAAFDYALAAASETVMDIRVQLSSCVPATDLVEGETRQERGVAVDVAPGEGRELGQAGRIGRDDDRRLRLRAGGGERDRDGHSRPALLLRAGDRPRER